MGKTPETELQQFVLIRIFAGIIISIAVIVGLAILIDMFAPPSAADTPESIAHNGAQSDPKTFHTAAVKTMDTPSPPSVDKKTAPAQHHDITPAVPPGENPPGDAFIEALIGPIEYELTRFWGWRPNDIIQFTDNVNEMQLGILEVTRRASVILTDKISRTGSTASLNPHLEQAMNSFMIKADNYWFPAPEQEYREAIKNLRKYQEQLHRGEATFYTRTDNLIPLLRAFEQLMGSCDENLVKAHEEDGSPVSTFAADNYFYYAKGVAIAVSPILEAVEIDFERVLEARNAKGVLHHAVEAAHHATHMKPWLFVTEASLNGIFANHRANMATHISHVRFYLGLLAETLST
jgi:hypothetical protein